MTSNTQKSELSEDSQHKLATGLRTKPVPESLGGTKERKDLLLGMYQENRCQARHYETVRATVVSFTLAAAVTISALMANNGLNIADRRLVLVLMVIGVYGTIFTSYYFKRIDCYEKLADEFCSELDSLFGRPEPLDAPRTIKAIQDKADRNWHRKFSLSGLRDGRLKTGELFRMYWPITISILPVLVMQWKFSSTWLP